MAGQIHVPAKYSASNPKIHFAEEFPVKRTWCGDMQGQATDRWRYVTCVECLRKAPDDPRIRARLDQVLRELQRKDEG